MMLLLAVAAVAAAPQQMHIAQGGMDHDKMTLSFITENEDAAAFCALGIDRDALNQKILSHKAPYTYTYRSAYDTEEYTSGYIHHHLASGLHPDTQYYYKCGSDASGWTNTYSFRTAQATGPGAKAVFALSMDIGQTNYSRATMQHILDDKTMTCMIIAGDLSYADSAWKPSPEHPCSQKRWDSWGEMIEPLAATLPTMVCPGNHEVEQEGDLPATQTEFLAYLSRFKMPWEESDGDQDSLYYSFNHGPAHFVMLNSYMDFSESSPQYAWLENDLNSVQRDVTPWLFVSFHAPWYNTNSHHEGEPEEFLMRDAMEHLLYDHKVDAVFAGHVHNYERTHNVYKNKTTDGAPVYITVGDGGNREGPATGWPLDAEWVAYREQSEEPERVFGHGRLEIFNQSHAKWEWHQLFDDELAKTDIGDSVWFVRNPSRGVTVTKYA